MSGTDPVVTSADDVAIETRFSRNLETGALMAHVKIDLGKEPLELWINDELVMTLRRTK